MFAASPNYQDNYVFDSCMNGTAMETQELIIHFI